MLLLDTHTWIWLRQGDHRLKSITLEKIESARYNRKLFISDISAWEIALLVKKNRLTLNETLEQWLLKANTKLRNISVSQDIFVKSTELPNYLNDTPFHNDPADRILVATARHHNLTIITADQKILNYAKIGFVKAISP